MLAWRETSTIGPGAIKPRSSTSNRMLAPRAVVDEALGPPALQGVMRADITSSACGPEAADMATYCFEPGPCRSDRQSAQSRESSWGAQQVERECGRCP